MSCPIVDDVLCHSLRGEGYGTSETAFGSKPRSRGGTQGVAVVPIHVHERTFLVPALIFILVLFRKSLTDYRRHGRGDRKPRVEGVRRG